MNKFAASLFAAAAMFAAPAIAQDTDITLRVDTGTIMASNGGEFQSANTGKPLMVGEKLMVNPGSSATAVFENGCTVVFNAPGVYEVPGECRKVAWLNSGANNGMNAGIIIAAGVIAAVLINSKDDVPVGPLSSAVRHF